MEKGDYDIGEDDARKQEKSGDQEDGHSQALGAHPSIFLPCLCFRKLARLQNIKF